MEAGIQEAEVVAAEAVAGRRMTDRAVICLCLVLTFPAGADEYLCLEHPHALVLEETGFEHVNHLLLLNGEVPVQELAEAMWFIENVSCAPYGYQLLASHRQYGDDNTRVFNLNIINREQYAIIVR